MRSSRDPEPFLPLPRDPDALPRVLGRAEARELGIATHVIDHALETGRWRRVLPRTYLTVDTFTELDRLVAALLFAGDGAALSGLAGLRAHEVRRIPMPPSVLVLVPQDNRTRSHSWVQVRATSRPVEIVQWTGPRRVEPCRAGADAALQMTRIDDVRALVARLVQDQHCTVDQLAAELEAGPRRGSALLRRALTEVGWGAASAPEARAARMMRRAGITGFVQNATIRFPDGSVRIADFLWPALRAILEIDSREWHFTAADWARTWDRHLQVTTGGYSVIHRPPSAMDDEQRFVTDVQTWLAGRAADLRAGLSA